MNVSELQHAARGARVDDGRLHDGRLDGGRIDDGWVTVGSAGDVPLFEGRSVEVGGRRIAVFRLADGWAAIDHACPHRGGPLSDGIVADSCVTCPLHNQRFSLTTGERQDGAGGGVRTYAVRDRDGQLELRAADLLAAELESAP